MNINSTVSTTGVFTTILVVILSFVLLKKKYTTSSCCKALCIGLLCLAIFAFLSVDLYGQGSCKRINTNPNTYKFVCKSKLTKMNLPTYFCDKELFCECTSNEDCPSSCNQCVNTICDSNPSNRLTIMNQNQRPNKIFIIFSVLSALILGVLIIKNYTNTINISKPIFITSIIILIVVEMFFTFYNSQKSYKEIVPISTCS